MDSEELSPQEKLNRLQEKSAIAKRPSLAKPNKSDINLSKSFANLGQLISPERDEVPAVVEWKSEFLFVASTCINLKLFVMVGFSSGVTALVNQLDDDNEWKTFFSESSSASAFVGAFLSFALVFRTNICYSRWWEGRQLWGKLIYAAIHSVQQSRQWIKHPEKARRLRNAVITFAWACKSQLRGNGIQDEAEEGDKLVDRNVICQRELNVMVGQPGWQAYYCLDVMRAVLNDAMLSDEDTNPMPDSMRNACLITMEETIRDLATAIGGLIRVKSTGLPMAYNAFFKAFALAFFLLSSLFWSPKLGWYTPIVIGVLFMVVNMIVTIGDCMEDPFGTDLTDLPMQKFCEVIEAQIKAVEKREIITFDLSVGPVDDDDNDDDKSKTVAFGRTVTFGDESETLRDESETTHDESETLLAVEV